MKRLSATFISFFGAVFIGISGTAKAEQTCQTVSGTPDSIAFKISIDDDYGTYNYRTGRLLIPATAELRCGWINSQADPMPYPAKLCLTQIEDDFSTQSIHIKIGTKDGSIEAETYAFVTKVSVFKKDIPLFPDEVSVSEKNFPITCNWTREIR